VRIVCNEHRAERKRVARLETVRQPDRAAGTIQVYSHFYGCARRSGIEWQDGEDRKHLAERRNEVSRDAAPRGTVAKLVGGNRRYGTLSGPQGADPREEYPVPLGLVGKVEQDIGVEQVFQSLPLSFFAAR
jgi:hypothetical protein